MLYPAQACPGGESGNACGAGYGDLGCRVCTEGHHRFAGRCYACLDSGARDFVFLALVVAHVALLYALWRFAEVAVKLGSLTAVSLTLNTLILVSFLRVSWPSSFIIFFRVVVLLAHVFFWPDFSNLWGWECAHGPLESTQHQQTLFTELQFVAPLVQPLLQVRNGPCTSTSRLF